MRTKKGQAMMELAFGMFALALVVSALCGFAIYIARSLKAQNAIRADMGPQGGSRSASVSVEVSAFAAEWIFNGTTLPIKEHIEFRK